MPTTLGKYTLHEELGRGGFATVYRATHTTLGTEAAVKVLNPALVGDEKSRQRFIGDAQIAASLDHAHIVRIIDLGEDQDQLFIAMEYFPCGDLSRWLQDHGPLSNHDLLRLLGQVASALDYAHSKNVLHRDIKPGNILMDAGGSGSLSDFGLARLLSDPHKTRIGSVVGSVMYLSPEQAQGLTNVDSRTDQYSLAVVAYELLTGQPPFQGENATSVAAMHVRKPPPVPSSLKESIPHEVDEALLRGLAKTPAERCASCTEFVRGLEAAFEAHVLRRIRELLGEAHSQLEQGQYAAVRQCLDAARALLFDYPELLNRPDLRSPLDELETIIHQTEGYEQGMKEWQTAKQKAQAVLDLFPNYPDPHKVFSTLDLRKPTRTTSERLLALARQAGAGLLIGLAGAALALAIAYWYISK